MSIATWNPVFSNFTSFTFPPCSPCYGTQLDTGNLRRIGDASSRLFENSSGEVFLHEKTLAEVIGERIVRPLVDWTVNAFSKTHSLMNSFLPAIPGAYAEKIPSKDELLHFPSSEELLSCLKNHTDPYSHGIVSVLADKLGGQYMFSSEMERLVIKTLSDAGINHRGVLAIMLMDIAEFVTDCAQKDPDILTTDLESDLIVTTPGVKRENRTTSFSR